MNLKFINYGFLTVVVKNLSCNAEDAGSIPRRVAKIPHAAGQLSPRTVTTEPMQPKNKQNK